MDAFTDRDETERAFAMGRNVRAEPTSDMRTDFKSSYIGRREKPPDHEARIRRYAKRASKGQPLFDDAESSCRS